MNIFGERRILGIDPGIGIIGYALVVEHGQKLILEECDAIFTPKEDSVSERLKTIYTELHRITAQLKPDEAAVEQLFFAKNVKTALIVGQARGVILLTLAMCELPVAEYTPLQVKQALTGFGAAKKEQVGEMVRLLLQLENIPKPDDAADAAAIAICHAHTHQLTSIGIHI